MRSIVVQAFAVGLILASQARAAPLEAKHVATNAKWLAHVDVDAIRASNVVQKAWQNVLERLPDTESNLGFVRVVIGTDLTKDIHGITIYGKGIGKSEVVTIVAVSMDPARLTLLASVIPGRETTSHGNYTIQNWTHMHGDHALTIAAAFRGHEQLVLASSIDDVKSALDVLDGKAPGLAADARLGGNIPAGTTLLVRAEEIADTKLGKAPFTEPINSFRVVMGESEGQSFFRARMTMANPEAVAYTMTAIHGGQALSNLICRDELGRKFVNAVQSKSDGQSVTILWSVPASDVWDGLVKIEEAVKKQITRLHGHDKHKTADKEEGKAPVEQGVPVKKTVPPEEDF